VCTSSTHVWSETSFVVVGFMKFHMWYEYWNEKLNEKQKQHYRIWYYTHLPYTACIHTTYHVYCIYAYPVLTKRIMRSMSHLFPCVSSNINDCWLSWCSLSTYVNTLEHAEESRCPPYVSKHIYLQVIFYNIL